MLSGLIQQFESLANELTIAVRCGHEAEVQALDLQLQRLIGRIFAVHARSRGDISAQIGFFNRLAVRDCDDGVSVRRYTGMMTALFHRYLEPDAGARPGPRAKTQHLLPNGYDPSVHEMLLDSVPERVAVISLDFRYIYCNAPNAAFHAKRPADFIGKHLSEIVGEESFRKRGKPRLEQCFAGARVSYKYEAHDFRGRMFEIDCRMTPFVLPDGSIAGGVIVLSMQPMFARTA